jgi:hypothetical protein
MSEAEIESVQSVGEEEELDDNKQTEKADEEHNWLWKLSIDCEHLNILRLTGLTNYAII